MSELIELTEEEINAGASAVAIPGGMGFEDRRLLVQAFAWAVNKMRAGDQVGTIRRHHSGNVVVLTEAGWVWIDRNGDTAESAPVNPSRWPVVFTPEAS